eukprot:scaffold5562_cov30-Phaeocystis_antarctica.AAC.1
MAGGGDDLRDLGAQITTSRGASPLTIHHSPLNPHPHPNPNSNPDPNPNPNPTPGEEARGKGAFEAMAQCHNELLEGCA